MSPMKQTTLEVNVSDEMAIAVSSIVLSLMNAKVYHQGADMILAKKGSSFLSFGEFLEVHTVPTHPDRSKISIMSKSAWSTTLIDWRVNSENIQRFEQLVRQLINLVKLLEKQKA